jgi:hypothetical protein
VVALTLFTPDLTKDRPGGPYFIIINKGTANVTAASVTITPGQVAFFGMSSTGTWLLLRKHAHSTAYPARIPLTHPAIDSVPAACRPAKYRLVRCDREDIELFTDRADIAARLGKVLELATGCFHVVSAGENDSHPSVIDWDDSPSKVWDDCEGCAGSAPGPSGNFPGFDATSDSAFNTWWAAHGSDPFLYNLWYGLTATSSAECLLSQYGIDLAPVLTGSFLDLVVTTCAGKTGQDFNFTTPDGKTFTGTYTGATTTCGGSSVCQVSFVWSNEVPS